MKIIRCAKADDAGAIRNIALKWNSNRRVGKGEGFLEYPVPSVGGYEQRIIGNPFFYVVTDKEEVVGFASAFTDGALRRLDFSGDEIVQHVLKEFGQFGYLDQVAMMQKYRGEGFGTRMIDETIKDMSRTGFRRAFGAVAHEPHRNLASIGLVEHFGFQLEEEIDVYNGLRFGIYRKDLG
jgi:ribosomal protein S18 acetylase RimI-like enzyme